MSDVDPGEREVSRKAILAFVWALMGVWGLFLIGPIVSLVYCRTAKRAILAEPRRLKGRELTEAARSLATCFLVLHSVIVLLCLAMLAILLSVSP